MIGLRRAILDRWGPLAEPGEPDPSLETTRFGRLPWDLRTLIAVMPPGAPFRFLNLNWVFGRTGTTFDRSRDRSRSRAREVVDLQAALDLGDRALTHKAEHPLAATTWRGAEASVEGRLVVSGARPTYRIAYRDPEADMALDIALSCHPGVMHWVRLSGLYRHYTTFATATVEGLGAPIRTPALLDHGFGRHLLPLRLPTGFFRYQVLRLPGDALAIALGVDGPLGTTYAAAALHRDGALSGGTARSTVLDWGTFTDHAGASRRLPTRWRTTVHAAGTTLSFLCEPAGPPRTVLGDGFLQAVSWEATALGDAASGAGYVEQLGNP